MSTFRCPACGAPLDYSGSQETTVRCPYCANQVGVPAELRPAPLALVVTPAAAPSAAPQPGTLLPAAPVDLRTSLHLARQARRFERRLARRAARHLPG